MNIAILTQPLKANYGCFLQNYALQLALKRIGHNPITIDYIPKMSKWRYFLSYCLTLLSKLGLGGHREFYAYPTDYLRPNIFNDFAEKNIVKTNTVNTYCKKTLIKYNVEGLIVGSDQVWRPKFNKESLEDMYFAFAGNLNLKRIAYAASFGVDTWEYTDKQTSKCKKLIEKFNAVSVRENSAIKLCSDNFGIKAKEVLDPTFLLEDKDYRSLCKDVAVNTEKYIAVYLLSQTHDNFCFINRIADEKLLKIKLFTADKDSVLSVEEWVATFRDASFVITDSFHGTAFSIIFQKDFLTIINKERGASRLFSLLSKFNLEDRLIDERWSTLHEPINWELVESYKKQHQTDAYDFLKINIV